MVFLTSCNICVSFISLYTLITTAYKYLWTFRRVRCLFCWVWLIPDSSGLLLVCSIIYWFAVATPWILLVLIEVKKQILNLIVFCLEWVSFIMQSDAIRLTTSALFGLWMPNRWLSLVLFIVLIGLLLRNVPWGHFSFNMLINELLAKS